MRFGMVMLPDESWQVTRDRWLQVEGLGFAHGWTYDHLVWSGLPDSPWRGALSTLGAVAAVTSRIRLGALVSSPNLHHPYTLVRELRAIHDISGGRLLCGLGAGGDVDAGIIGQGLTLKQRVDRFHEFVRLFHRLMHDDRVSHEGAWYTTVEARTLPLDPPLPMVIAANGPRSLRLAAELGTGWVTTGPRADTLEHWWRAVGDSCRMLDDALAGRTIDRYLSLDASPQFSLESVGVFDEMVGRATGLGFTDVIVHYPRSDSPYRGNPDILNELNLTGGV